MILSGASRLAGIMGWPVTHSLSPRLHGFWLERHGIDGAYVPLPVRPEAFEAALHALAELGFRGVNVTLPHKEQAARACDQVDATARRIGAVNLIEFRDGNAVGSNSDAFGFIENLRQNAPAWRAEGAPAAVLGAGGAARAVIVALLDAGVPELRLANRTPERAAALAETFGEHVRCVAWGERDAALEGCGLLVNTTTLGMRGQAPLEIGLEALPADAVVADIVYSPLETDLLARAEARGHVAVEGLGMLLHQARPAFEAWFGVRPEVDQDLRRFVLAGLGGA